jgi:hypothetical protein
LAYINYALNSGSRSSTLDNTNAFAVSAPALVQDRPIPKGEQGIVATLADVVAGMNARTTLPHKDSPCADVLSPKALHAEALGIAVASVARTADALLVCHAALSFRASSHQGLGSIQGLVLCPEKTLQ